MEKNMKGQAAMEYLMTYGWAILVLVIVIAALYYFLPKAQDQCLFQQGFMCEGLPQIYVEGGEVFVSVKMSNKLPSTIDNIQIVCMEGTGNIPNELFEGTKGTTWVQATTGNPEDASGVEDAGQVGPGSTFNARAVPCVAPDGEPIQSTAGSGFKGVLAIKYNLNSDIDTTKKHLTSGIISGTLVE